MQILTDPYLYHPPFSYKHYFTCPAFPKSHIIIYSSRNTIRIKQMQKQFSFFDRIRQQRELKMMKDELAKREEQIGLKDARIEELQRRVMELMDQEIKESIAIEEEIQCSIDHEVALDRGQLVQQMKGLLAELQEKEEQGLGLHLALLNRDRKMDELEAQLLQKDEQTQEINKNLAIIKERMDQQEALLTDLKDQNNDLLQRNIQLQEQLLIKESELAELKQTQQNLSVRSKQGQTEEDIMNQNQKVQKHQESREMRKSRELREVAERDLMEMTEQAEKMKKIINNYDWKLFCLETELDLSNKEKKQYRYVNDKNQMRISEFQSQIKHQTIKIYGLEEDLKLMTDENKKMQMEVIRKQMKIDELLDEIDEIKEGKQQEENEDMKELRYRIQEKDEELKEITNYLKEKINENHQVKLKASQLEKALTESQKKAEKIEFGSYQLEQSIIQCQELIEKQTEKIDECTNQNQFLSKKINDLSLMNILRAQEFQAKVANLENLVKDKSAKVNELSVEIIEREIQANKKMEELNAQLEQMEVIRQQLEDVIIAKEYAEQDLQAHQRENALLTKEIERLTIRVRNCEQSLNGKDKTIQMFRNTIKSLEEDIVDAAAIRTQLEEELEEALQSKEVNEEKLKILKKEAVDYMNNQLKYQQQIESLNQQKAILQADKSRLEDALIQQVADKSRLEDSLTQQLAASQQMKKQVKELHAITKQRMQEMLDFLSPPSSEHTTTFQLLDEDDFEVMTCEKQQMRKRMHSLNKELTTICTKHFQ